MNFCILAILASTTFDGNYNDLNSTRSMMYFNRNNIVVMHPSSYDSQVTVIETTKEHYFARMSAEKILKLPCE